MTQLDRHLGDVIIYGNIKVLGNSSYSRYNKTTISSDTQGFVVPSLYADPSSGNAGEIFFDASINILKIYQNNNWTNIISDSSVVSTFIELIDVPNSYIGNSLKVLRVNSGETGIEFTDDIYNKIYIDGSLNNKVNLSGDTMSGYLHVQSDVSIDGSLYSAGKEVTSYSPSLSDSLQMPNTVGGIVAGTSVADLRGDLYETLFNNLLFPTVSAYIASQNTTTLSGVTIETIEVGTLVTAITTGIYDPGLIKNGDDSNGPTLTGNANQYLFKLPDGTEDASIISSSNSEGHTFTGYNVLFGTNTWSVIINYDAGSGAYYDNKGVAQTNLDASRVASSKTNSTPSKTGRRYAWRGYGTQTSAPTDSSGVRSLSSKSFLGSSDTGTFDISIPSGTQEVYFYVPIGKTVLVQYVESSFADVTASFTSGSITINDAGGNGQSYESWVSYIGVGGYPSTATYRVTIS